MTGAADNPVVTSAAKPLTEPERTELADLTSRIKAELGAFVRVGSMLARIAEARLYRETHPTFKAFCRDVFDLSAPYAYAQIAAAQRVEELSGIQDVPLPQNLAQVAELAGLPSTTAAEVMRTASAGGPLTASRIRQARTEHQPRPAASAAQDRTDALRAGADGITADIEKCLAEGWPAAYLLTVYTKQLQLDRGQEAFTVPIEAVREFWRPILDRLRELTVAEACAYFDDIAPVPDV